MASKPKTKTQGGNIEVPQSKEEASMAVHDIGVAQRRIARVEADMNDRIAKAKQEAEERSNPLKDKIRELTEGLRIWAEANRKELTNGDKRKFADLGTGKIEWRLRPPSVTIRGLEAVLDAIRKLGLAGKFIRAREEVNKEAMLAEPDAARLIPGVSIGTAGETFYVEPFEAEIEGAGK